MKFVRLFRVSFLMVLLMGFVGCSSLQVTDSSTTGSKKQKFSNKLNQPNLLISNAKVVTQDLLTTNTFASYLELQKPIELPNSKYDWILTLKAIDGTPFTAAQIAKVLSVQNFNSNIYVMHVGSSIWKPFQAKSAGEAYSTIAISYKLYNPSKPNGYAQEDLERYKKLIDANVAKLSYKSARYNYSVTQATDVSHKIAWVVAKNQRWAIIKLRAKRSFRVKAVKNTMESLGLVIGERPGQFFWKNTDFENADSKYMMVWTPENSILEDNEITELIFGFSIPRSIAPLEIYNAMHNIVVYTQQELGGIITDRHGELLNTTKDKAQIKMVLKSLDEEGMQPGTGDALYVFEDTYTE